MEATTPDENLLEKLEAAPMGEPAATDAGPEDPPADPWNAHANHVHLAV